MNGPLAYRLWLEPERDKWHDGPMYLGRFGAVWTRMEEIMMESKSEGTTRRGFLATTAAAAALGTIGFNRIAQAEDTSEMITQLVRLKMQAGKEEEAIATLKVLTAAVEENEPGVLAYSAHRSQKNPSEIVFFEVYENAAASAAHGAAPHMRAMFPKFPSLFEGGMDLEKMDRVGGYTRES